MLFFDIFRWHLFLDISRKYKNWLHPQTNIMSQSHHAVVEVSVRMSVLRYLHRLCVISFCCYSLLFVFSYTIDTPAHIQNSLTGLKFLKSTRERNTPKATNKHEYILYWASKTYLNLEANTMLDETENHRQFNIKSFLILFLFSALLFWQTHTQKHN